MPRRNGTRRATGKDVITLLEEHHVVDLVVPAELAAAKAGRAPKVSRGRPDLGKKLASLVGP